MVGLMAVLYIHKSPKIWASLFWLVCCFPSNVVYSEVFFCISINIQKSGLMGLGGGRGPDIVSIYEYRNNIFMKIINNIYNNINI